MALSNLTGWNANNIGSACGASDKPEKNRRLVVQLVEPATSRRSKFFPKCVSGGKYPTGSIRDFFGGGLFFA